MMTGVMDLELPGEQRRQQMIGAFGDHLALEVVDPPDLPDVILGAMRQKLIQAQFLELPHHFRFSRSGGGD